MCYRQNKEKTLTKIYSRQSSPPLPHRLQCSGSQDSFATDSYCGNGGGVGGGGGNNTIGPSASSQWQIPSCADTICLHSVGQLAGVTMPPANLMQPTGTVMPSMPPMFANGGGKLNSIHNFINTSKSFRLKLQFHEIQDSNGN